MLLMRTIALLCLALLLTACGEKKEVNQYRVPKEPGTTAASPHASGMGDMNGMGTMGSGMDLSPAPAESGYVWQAPEGWTEAESTSSMRLASFAVPHDEETGDLSVIRLGGAAGGMLANLNRWRGQLGLGPVAPDTAEAMGQTTDSPAGTFTWWTIVNEDVDPSLGMLAAMLEGPDHVMFVKLTGSAELASAQEASFAAFLASFEPAGGDAP